jgi:hypothetical protein
MKLSTIVFGSDYRRMDWESARNRNGIKSGRHSLKRQLSKARRKDAKKAIYDEILDLA